MKFLSINLVAIVILLLAISLTGCDHSALNGQPDVPGNKTANLIGVWYLISDNNITDSEHQLEFDNNTLTEIISKTDLAGSCVDDPQLYREFEWNETQHPDQLKLVTVRHVECGSELSAGNEHMVTFHLEDDVLHFFDKRWERAIFVVD